MPIKKPAEPDSAATMELDAPTARSLSDLVDAMLHGTTSQRLSALRELSRHNERQAVDALCAALTTEKETSTRDIIAVELARRGGEHVVDGLLPILSSDDAALRNIAIDILKELPSAVAPRMEELLDDPDPDVRIFLVNVLEALRHPSVEDWLIAVITMDSNVNVVITALDLLNEVGTESAIPALRRAISRYPDEPFVIFSADSAIRRIEGLS